MLSRWWLRCAGASGCRRPFSPPAMFSSCSRRPAFSLGSGRWCASPPCRPSGRRAWCCRAPVGGRRRRLARRLWRSFGGCWRTLPPPAAPATRGGALSPAATLFCTSLPLLAGSGFSPPTLARRLRVRAAPSRPLLGVWGGRVCVVSGAEPPARCGGCVGWGGAVLDVPSSTLAPCRFLPPVGPLLSCWGCPACPPPSPPVLFPPPARYYFHRCPLRSLARFLALWCSWASVRWHLVLRLLVGGGSAAPGGGWPTGCRPRLLGRASARSRRSAAPVAARIWPEPGGVGLAARALSGRGM